jgi:branched-subunit amino acid transport protein
VTPTVNRAPVSAPLSGVQATVITHGFFLLSERELVLPEWATRCLRYAPLAALAAVVVPEVGMTPGQLFATWQDARICAVLASTLDDFWRGGILGTIVSGMLVLLALKLGPGW